MCVSHVPRLLMFARTLLLPSGYQELSPTRDDGRAEVASREVIILRRCRRRPVPNRDGAGTTMDARRPARDRIQAISIHEARKVARKSQKSDSLERFGRSGVPDCQPRAKSIPRAEKRP